MENISNLHDLSNDLVKLPQYFNYQWNLTRNRVGHITKF